MGIFIFNDDDGDNGKMSILSFILLTILVLILSRAMKDERIALVGFLFIQIINLAFVNDLINKDTVISSIILMIPLLAYSKQEKLINKTKQSLKLVTIVFILFVLFLGFKHSGESLPTLLSSKGDGDLREIDYRYAFSCIFLIAVSLFLEIKKSMGRRR